MTISTVSVYRIKKMPKYKKTMQFFLFLTNHCLDFNETFWECSIPNNDARIFSFFQHRVMALDNLCSNISFHAMIIINFNQVITSCGRGYQFNEICFLISVAVSYPSGSCTDVNTVTVKSILKHG